MVGSLVLAYDVECPSTRDPSLDHSIASLVANPHQAVKTHFPISSQTITGGGPPIHPSRLVVQDILLSVLGPQ
eukprot:15975772-Heterocapsa_arctica.AAC.1